VDRGEGGREADRRRKILKSLGLERTEEKKRGANTSIKHGLGKEGSKGEE